MTQVADFTDSEWWTVETTLGERYGDSAPTAQRADSEIRRQPGDRELASCPIAFWEHDGCHFVVMKTGERNYRCQFFYRLHEQFGTSIREYNDLAECLVTLLQTQADQRREQRQQAPA